MVILESPPEESMMLLPFSLKNKACIVALNLYIRQGGLWKWAHCLNKYIDGQKRALFPYCVSCSRKREGAITYYMTYLDLFTCIFGLLHFILHFFSSCGFYTNAEP